MISERPILVTGAPRSGTTWVGRMISQAPGVRYIHEPFNVSRRPCRCGVKFENWFQYLSPENLPFFHGHLKHIIFPAFSRIGLLNLISEIWNTRRIRPVFGYSEAYLFRRAVVKDPLAVFSASTLADLFDMDVVILFRHPAAIVSSFKRLDWSHSFLHFLSQPELMEDHLSPFRSEIEDFSRNTYHIVDQVALLWKLIHHMIIKYQETQPEWIFVCYEDLALDPIEGYRSIFARLKIPFSERISRVVEAHSVQNRIWDTTDPYSIRQNPRLVVSKWKRNLTGDEIYRIRARVEPVSSVFYTDAEWKI